MTTNEKKLIQFYTAFANGDSQLMSTFYAQKVSFRDPAFGLLKDNNVPKMWNMLLEKSKGKLKIEFSNVKADEYTGSVNWIATYNFSKTNRKVVNVVHSTFHFKEELIIKQVDSFDIWKWSKQAFGLTGLLFGWTGYMQKKIQEKALLSLKLYKTK